MIIVLHHISGICPVKIEDVSEILDGTLSEFLELEFAHRVWSDGYQKVDDLANRIASFVSAGDK